MPTVPIGQPSRCPRDVLDYPLGKQCTAEEMRIDAARKRVSVPDATLAPWPLATSMPDVHPKTSVLERTIAVNGRPGPSSLWTATCRHSWCRLARTTTGGALVSRMFHEKR